MKFEPHCLRDGQERPTAKALCRQAGFARAAARAGGTFHRAFTLMELLLVLVVIMLLVGLTFPTFNRMAVNGRSVKCTSNLRNIGVAISAFTQDNGGNLPSGRQVQEGEKTRTVVWTELLWPYLYEGKYVGYSRPELPKSLSGTVFECPEAHYDLRRNPYITYVRSYGMNHYLGDRNEKTGDLLASLPDPQQVCVLADAKNESQLRPFTINPRHNHTFNALFADGHVATLTQTADHSDIMAHPFWGVVPK